MLFMCRSSRSCARAAHLAVVRFVQGEDVLDEDAVVALLVVDDPLALLRCRRPRDTEWQASSIGS